MDCIRRRLYKLSNLQLPASLGDSFSTRERRVSDAKSTCNDLHSTKSLYAFSPGRTAYQKMIELESRRYEILQRQTDESYDNLSCLLRLSIPSEGCATDTDATCLVTGDNPSKQTHPKLHFNKIYLSHLSETYRDLNDSLTIIKNTLTGVDEMKNSRDK